MSNEWESSAFLGDVGVFLDGGGSADSKMEGNEGGGGEIASAMVKR